MTANDRYVHDRVAVIIAYIHACVCEAMMAICDRRMMHDVWTNMVHATGTRARCLQSTREELLASDLH